MCLYVKSLCVLDEHILFGYKHAVCVCAVYVLCSICM